MNNCPKLVWKLFAVLCPSLGTRLITTTEYHPQSREAKERYNKPLVARLQHYIEEYESDWYLLFQLITLYTTPMCLALRKRPRLASYWVVNPHKRFWIRRSPTVTLVSLLQFRQNWMWWKTFWHLQTRAEKAYKFPRESFKTHFNQRVHQSTVFWCGKRIYISRLVSVKAIETDSLDERRSINPLPKRTNHYQLWKCAIACRQWKLTVSILQYPLKRRFWR